MVPIVHPTPQSGGSTLVFVPVDGRLVFWTCGLLIVFCLVWLGMLLQKGVEHDKET